ncbi:hypothetical protein [Carnobacterium maltaromaticum]|jgi:hypothetical protein|uniref:hypothetical protein n=1 Tax=Carnobacterium maltaromaticum TaxID=2751 RepID=UPI001C4DF117|nr:hypothetical protein [Carnobacterium maltaromaticum]MCI1819304.1 hypothetical protein [Carnobacterium maltaromaticum]
MWWIVLLIIAYMLFTRLDDIIELSKSKSPDYQKEVEQRQYEHQQERKEITQQLRALIGSECRIKSSDLIYMSNGSSEIKAKISQVDDDWVEVLTLRKKKHLKVYIKIESINSLSKIVAEE